MNVGVAARPYSPAWSCATASCAARNAASIVLVASPRRCATESDRCRVRGPVSYAGRSTADDFSTRTAPSYR